MKAKVILLVVLLQAILELATDKASLTTQSVEQFIPQQSRHKIIAVWTTSNFISICIKNNDQKRVRLSTVSVTLSKL